MAFADIWALLFWATVTSATIHNNYFQPFAVVGLGQDSQYPRDLRCKEDRIDGRLRCSAWCLEHDCTVWSMDGARWNCTVCARCEGAGGGPMSTGNGSVWRKREIETQAPPVPALYLSMDQIGASVLAADVGNIQGALENAPVLVPNGVRGKALQLDGIDQAINFGNQKHRCLGEFRHCLSGWTVMFWGKLTIPERSSYILSGGAQASNTDGVAISWNTPGLLVRVKIATEQWAAKWKDFTPNEWFNLVATWHNTTGLALYVDGCLVKHRATSAPVTYDYNGEQKDLVMGRANSAGYAPVILDEFYMYEKSVAENFASTVYWYYFLGA